MINLNSNLFRCKQCKCIAEWLVWYKGCGSLYNYLCTYCTVEEMKELANTEYPIVCIRSVADAIPNMLNKGNQ